MDADKREWQIYKEPGAPCTIFGPLTPGLLVVPKSELERVQGLLDEACEYLIGSKVVLENDVLKESIQVFLEKVRGGK